MPKTSDHRTKGGPHKGYRVAGGGRKYVGGRARLFVGLPSSRRSGKSCPIYGGAARVMGRMCGRITWRVRVSIQIKVSLVHGNLLELWLGYLCVSSIFLFFMNSSLVQLLSSPHPFRHEFLNARSVYARHSPPTALLLPSNCIRKAFP